MSVRIVRLGTARLPEEGPRLGTVRRPPRGVPREEYARRDFYDVWLPNLAPSQELLSAVKANGPAWWGTFTKRYRAEMGRPEASHLLDALALLSRTSHFSVGCYCEEEEQCHRSVLRELFAERGASISG